MDAQLLSSMIKTIKVNSAQHAVKRLVHRRASPVCREDSLRGNNLIRAPEPISEYLLDTLRCIRYRDPETQKTFVFLTNNFTVAALTIARLYRTRWRVELFFEWIKRRLRIEAFYGTSENAVKTQVRIAIAVYVLAATVNKRLNLGSSIATYFLFKRLDLPVRTIIVTRTTW